MQLKYALAAALALTPAAAMADWPVDKQITLVVGYSAGGGTDILARTMAPFLEKYIDGAKFVVLNKPGPGGEYGFTETANAAPDGYTIGFMNAPAFITLPYERETRYSFDMFAPIANLVTDPATLNMPGSSTIDSLDAFVAAAKENPNASAILENGPADSVSSKREDTEI